MKKKILFGVLAFICVTQLVYAASTWSDAYLYEVHKKEDWKRETAGNEWMGNQKDSDSQKYDVYTVSKTIWSAPMFRVVNSDNNQVADPVATAGTGRYATGYNNTGIIGHGYYGSIKPAWNQASDVGRIKLQFRVY